MSVANASIPDEMSPPMRLVRYLSGKTAIRFFSTPSDKSLSHANILVVSNARKKSIEKQDVVTAYIGHKIRSNDFVDDQCC